MTWLLKDKYCSALKHKSMSGQTVQTSIRLVLEEQSDRNSLISLHFLQFLSASFGSITLLVKEVCSNF